MPLTFHPATDHKHLVSPSIAKLFSDWKYATPLSEILVSEVDPQYAGGDALCEHYGVRPEDGANCVIVEAVRGERRTIAACVAPVGVRADLNGKVRKLLDAKRVSFAARDEVLEKTQMEFGSITPIGLPEDWIILVDKRVFESSRIIVGSGKVCAKLSFPGYLLGELTGAQIIETLS